MDAQTYIQKAMEKKDYIIVEPEMVDDKIYCLIVHDCWDYQSFKKLPEVVEYKDELYSRLSFNSDNGKAVYKITGNIAKVVK